MLAAIIVTVAIIVVKKTGPLIAVKTMLRILVNLIAKSQICHSKVEWPFSLKSSNFHKIDEPLACDVDVNCVGFRLISSTMDISNNY